MVSVYWGLAKFTCRWVRRPAVQRLVLYWEGGQLPVFRTAIYATLIALLLVSSSSAQEWARKMFESTSHDFGTVARGAKSVHRFKVTNIYKETVHIAGVRSSCGCSTPTISKDTIETYESGEIVVQFNTHSFLGAKSATITVTIDRPFQAEVQLEVQGNVRSDLVIHPGAVQFGNVDQGTPVEKRIAINHAGGGNWQLVDVQSRYEHVEVEIKRAAAATASTAAYELVVRLKDDAPVGYVNEQLILVTNDAQTPRIPLAIEGRVSPELTVTPASLYLGELEVGQEVTKQLVVRGKQPFRIVEVNCPDECFSFKAAPEAKTLHLVAVTFKPMQAGQVKQTIGLKTDRSNGVGAALVAYANVISPAEEKASFEKDD